MYERQRALLMMTRVLTEPPVSRGSRSRTGACLGLFGLTPALHEPNCTCHRTGGASGESVHNIEHWENKKDSVVLISQISAEKHPEPSQGRGCMGK